MRSNWCDFLCYEMSDYQEKYLKYKAKYERLLGEITGGGVYGFVDDKNPPTFEQ